MGRRSPSGVERGLCVSVVCVSNILALAESLSARLPCAYRRGGAFQSKILPCPGTLSRNGETNTSAKRRIVADRAFVEMGSKEGQPPGQGSALSLPENMILFQR